MYLSLCIPNVIESSTIESIIPPSSAVKHIQASLQI
jgi:hypothetical protein